MPRLFPQFFTRAEKIELSLGLMIDATGLGLIATPVIRSFLNTPTACATVECFGAAFQHFTNSMMFITIGLAVIAIGLVLTLGMFTAMLPRRR